MKLIDYQQTTTGIIASVNGKRAYFIRKDSPDETLVYRIINSYDHCVLAHVAPGIDGAKWYIEDREGVSV